MRVIGYIDGMNFYEASKAYNYYPMGWCNWTETIRSHRHATTVEIRYFTTKLVKARRVRTDRQELHLRAMREVANAEIIFGRQKQSPLTCPKCSRKISCICGCEDQFSEKESDINIAVRLLEDAIDERFDVACLVSGDTDFVPAVRASLRRNPAAKIDVLFPPYTSGSWDWYKSLEAEYPRRLTVRTLDLSKMVRFPEDLAKKWGYPFPRHWRLGSGPRPIDPDEDAPVTRQRARYQTLT